MSGDESAAAPELAGTTSGETGELAPDLQVVVAENAGPLTLDGTRSYIIGSSRVVVLDPGPAHAGHLQRVVSAVGDRLVAWVCLTHAHPDHAAGAAAAAEALEAPLAASEDTLRRLSLAGRPLQEGDELPVDGGRSTLRILETPGHSADSLSLMWLSSRRLFTGDLVLGEGTSVVVYPDGSVGAYLTSLVKLVALRPTLILPGHGEPVREPVRQLEHYRRHRLEREAQIQRAVSRGAHSIEEIRCRVYAELPVELTDAAELSIRAHLHHLQEIGQNLPGRLLSVLGDAAPSLGE